MTGSDPNLIQISLAALAKMIKFDLSKPGTETVGLLIGKEEAGVVHIEDVRLGDQTGNAVHVEVSEAELTQAAIEISERDDGLVIVGWIHTHPGLSAFMSGTDIRTQSLYQAFMPNSIAIVVDPLQYGKTFALDDLDLKVFRVTNDKAVELRYTMKNTIDFGLYTFVTGGAEVEVHPAEPIPKVHQIKVPSKERIKMIKAHLKINQEKIAEEDLEAISAWVELVETMESGDIREVPIEVDSMMNRLNGSLGIIEDQLQTLTEEVAYRKDSLTLLGIFFGVFLEILVFYFAFAV